MFGCIFDVICVAAFGFTLKEHFCEQVNLKHCSFSDNFSFQLRAHLELVKKHQHQQTAINLNNPESQAMHLETRLAQLESAINMELWQVGQDLKL